MSEISASIEETNKIRAALGLKPLKAGPGTSKEGQAEKNLTQHKEEEARKARESEIKAKIAKSKYKRDLQKTLAGKSLGETDGDEDDTAKLDVHEWTMRLRQREKDAAARRARELQEMDDAYQQEPQQSYDEGQLTGLRVGHDMSDFVEGEERILTLKDARILEENDEDGDELINIQMSEQKRLQTNLENKKKSKQPVYNAYDDDEFTVGKKKNILSQYDEVLGEETKAEGFVIGKKLTRRQGVETNGSLGGVPGGGAIDARERMLEKLKASAVDLSYTKNQLGQDYYTKEEVEVTFKKSKKKKKSRTRKTEGNNWDNDDGGGDDNGDAMEVEPPTPLDISELNFVDDDDLQASLAKTRRLATKKSVKKLTPEDIAKNLASQAMAIDTNTEEAVPGGLVISDVSEFVSNLSSASAQAPVVVPTPAPVMSNASPAADAPSVKRTTVDDVEDEDEEMAEPDRARTRAVSEEAEGASSNNKDGGSEEKDQPLDDEPVVSRGLGATLAMLKSRGIFGTETAEQNALAEKRAKRAKFLAEQKLEEARTTRELEGAKLRDRERHRERAGRGMNEREQRERDYEKERREQQMLDRRTERMRDYEPDIQLKYLDDEGHELNTKDAFRHLSHKFHGKAPGKMKTEKRMKKLEEEKRMMSMTATDTPLNMAMATQERLKASGQAHLVLAVGNRNLVPSSSTDAITGTVSTLRTSSASSSSATKGSTIGGTISTFVSQTSTASTAISGVNAPNREKVAFGLKRKAEAAAGSETVPKRSREQ
ncbi:hypothetical protein DFQ26_000598 [Actinomortierella ambigua]|nr:hypothetical protein DFQ26_000598 [Actinomortierella ambigua]